MVTNQGSHWVLASAAKVPVPRPILFGVIVGMILIQVLGCAKASFKQVHEVNTLGEVQALLEPLGSTFRVTWPTNISNQIGATSHFRAALDGGSENDEFFIKFDVPAKDFSLWREAAIKSEMKEYEQFQNTRSSGTQGYAWWDVHKSPRGSVNHYFKEIDELPTNLASLAVYTTQGDQKVHMYIYALILKR